MSSTNSEVLLVLGCARGVWHSTVPIDTLCIALLLAATLKLYMVVQVTRHLNVPLPTKREEKPPDQDTNEMTDRHHAAARG